MNLLNLVSQASLELGLGSVDQVVSATDQQTLQLLALIEGLGNELATDYGWQKGNITYDFAVQTESQSGTLDGTTSVTGLSDTSAFAADTWQVTGDGIPTQTYISSVDSGTAITLTNAATTSGSSTLTFTQVKYSLPSDWNYQVNSTEWDRTNNWEILGPKTPQSWAKLENGVVATSPRILWRIQEGYFQIFPGDPPSSTLAYEYQSTYWITATGSSVPTKSAFTVDTDSTIFRDRLMITGLKLKFFESKGFNTVHLEKSYKRELEKAMSQDHAAQDLSLSQSRSPYLLSTANVPDTDYGS